MLYPHVLLFTSALLCKIVISKGSEFDTESPAKYTFTQKPQLGILLWRENYLKKLII